MVEYSKLRGVLFPTLRNTRWMLSLQLQEKNLNKDSLKDFEDGAVRQNMFFVASVSAEIEMSRKTMERGGITDFKKK